MAYRRALVTGGAGFIGSHVVDRLLQQGFHVAVVDNLSTGKPGNVSQSAAFYNVDIRSRKLGGIFRQEQPEVVFHLAAQASVPSSIARPVEDARNNVLGSLNLLEQCKRYKVERFIYTSTGGALYGDPQQLPCAETDPIRPVSPYGASKFAAEVYVGCYAILGGFQYSVLRCANVYGPRQDPLGEAGVIAIFAKQMLDGDRVVIFGDGNYERDFVYVSDVVEANMKALEQTNSDVYNIGTGSGTSVNSIASKLFELTGYLKKPDHGPVREGDVSKIYLDVRKAKRDLGWTPKVSLDQGLANTVAHIKAMKPGSAQTI
jgi:UDP-glucose 4-epimerase